MSSGMVFVQWNCGGGHQTMGSHVDDSWISTSGIAGTSTCGVVKGPSDDGGSSNMTCRDVDLLDVDGAQVEVSAEVQQGAAGDADAEGEADQPGGSHRPQRPVVEAAGVERRC